MDNVKNALPCALDTPPWLRELSTHQLTSSFSHCLDQPQADLLGMYHALRDSINVDMRVPFYIW